MRNMKQFATAWKSSANPGKQRKYAAMAPLHLRHHFLSAHLSKELRGKYKRRSIPVIKGDVVRIVRGQFRNKSGKVLRIQLNSAAVFVEGIDTAKKDGSKSGYPLHPSNLVITELNLSDKMREAKLTAQ